MNSVYFNDDDQKVLSGLRETFGEGAQILVCVEELSELTGVLTKYPRYSDKDKAKESLHDKALDEVADVLIILEHATSILGLTQEEVNDRIHKKLARASRWLENGKTMQVTLDIRRV